MFKQKAYLPVAGHGLMHCIEKTATDRPEASIGHVRLANSLVVTK